RQSRRAVDDSSIHFSGVVNNPQYRQCGEDLDRFENNELPAAREFVQQLTVKRDEALDALTQAKAKVQGIEAARSEARTNRRQVEKDLASAKKDSATTQQALETATLDYWRSGLLGGEADARLILNWANQPVQYDAQRGVTRPAGARDPALPVVVRSHHVLATRAEDELRAFPPPRPPTSRSVVGPTRIMNTPRSPTGSPNHTGTTSPPPTISAPLIATSGLIMLP
ncbi:MAG: hypothetical protein ACRDQU_11910, partial [Pseudonocardiaceae bacterium]